MIKESNRGDYVCTEIKNDRYTIVNLNNIQDVSYYDKDELVEIIKDDLERHNNGDRVDDDGIVLHDNHAIQNIRLVDGKLKANNLDYYMYQYNWYMRGTMLGVVSHPTGSFGLVRHLGENPNTYIVTDFNNCIGLDLNVCSLMIKSCNIYFAAADAKIRCDLLEVQYVYAFEEIISFAAEHPKRVEISGRIRILNTVREVDFFRYVMEFVDYFLDCHIQRLQFEDASFKSEMNLLCRMEARFAIEDKDGIDKVMKDRFGRQIKPVEWRREDRMPLIYALSSVADYMKMLLKCQMCNDSVRGDMGKKLDEIAKTAKDSFAAWNEDNSKFTVLYGQYMEYVGELLKSCDSLRSRLEAMEVNASA